MMSIHNVVEDCRHLVRGAGVRTGDKMHNRAESGDEDQDARAIVGVARKTEDEVHAHRSRTSVTI